MAARLDTHRKYGGRVGNTEGLAAHIPNLNIGLSQVVGESVFRFVNSILLRSLIHSHNAPEFVLNQKSIYSINNTWLNLLNFVGVQVAADKKEILVYRASI